MKELIVATRNRGKISEISELLTGLVETVTCVADVADFPETIEDGATFEANALKKAREACGFSGLPSLADDSGLVVAALDGRPGVYSARFAGEGAGDSANNTRLLHELQGVSPDKRTAAFVCALAFVTPDGHEEIFRGRVEGSILEVPRGESGFGYDPLFLVAGGDQTMAELDMDTKNRISHRGEAFRQFREYLERVEAS